MTRAAQPAPSSGFPDAPVLVEVTRGDLVESRHRGRMAICNDRGEILFACGDVQGAFYPRSAVKPVQAMALVESGAADHFGLGERELALACASHNGEKIHTEAVLAWLAGAGLAESHLQCGCHPPMDSESAEALIREGQAPGPRHHNCSGKHTGFLTLARHLSVSLDDYREPDHPSQKAWAEALSDLAGEDVTAAASGIDGCGIPVRGISLAGFATALARFGHAGAPGAVLQGKRAEAASRLTRAIAACPHMLAGKDRLCTLVIQESGGRIIAKSGAEATYGAFWPEKGLGIAVKIEDGSSRASEIALGEALRIASVLTGEGEGLSGSGKLRERFHPLLYNFSGKQIGEIRSVAQST